MKRLCIVFLLAAGLLASCQKEGDVRTTLAGGLVESSEQRTRRISHIDEFNRRMFADDWDAIWLYERSSFLMPWVPRVGR